MLITLAEVVDLFRKWQTERRLLQCGVFVSPHSSGHAVGRIEVLTGDSLRVDARSLYKFGEQAAMFVSFQEALTFHFEDWRDAPEEFSKPLHDNYDSLIFIEFATGHCEIYALKRSDELPSLCGA
ncbi:MAG: hypothetical protein WA188_10965 [Terriglobales bacterium]